jgi:hypothetical protein
MAISPHSTSKISRATAPSTFIYSDQIAANGRSIAENFKAWFKKGKVLNSNGQPMRLFHGTDQDFDSFDLDSIGNNFRADTLGFFFINDPKQASGYAENDTVGLSKKPLGRVIPVYISMQKPLIINDAFLRSQGMAPLGVCEDVISFWDSYQALIHEWMFDHGSDGVILVDNSYQPHGEPTTMVVALHPWQIKSACGNAGTYDPDDNDMTDRRSLDMSLTPAM